MCDRDSKPGEINQPYPTNVYIYVDDGRKCTGTGNNNFEFDHWAQNLSRSSFLTIKEPSGETSNYLTVVLPHPLLQPSDLLLIPVPDSDTPVVEAKAVDYAPTTCVLSGPIYSKVENGRIFRHASTPAHQEL